MYEIEQAKNNVASAIQFLESIRNRQSPDMPDPWNLAIAISELEKSQAFIEKNLGPKSVHPVDIGKSQE